MNYLLFSIHEKIERPVQYIHCTGTNDSIVIFVKKKKKSKWKKSCILQKAEESNPVFSVVFSFFLETSVNWVDIDQLFGDFLS
jgi:hypothetical protein